MITCPDCNGRGEYSDYTPMGDEWHHCERCRRTGKILSEFEVNEIKINKALDECWEKNR